MGFCLSAGFCSGGVEILLEKVFFFAEALPYRIIYYTFDSTNSRKQKTNVPRLAKRKTIKPEEFLGQPAL